MFKAKQPKLYVPGYFVLYQDKTVKFNPFTTLKGERKKVKRYVKVLADNGDPVVIGHRQYVKAWWGFKLVDQIGAIPSFGLTDELLQDILGPDRFRNCG